MEPPIQAISVNITPDGAYDLDMMRDLSELAGDLQNADLGVKTTSADVPGVKDGGLTIAISLAGLALSAVSTLVTVLSYWNSKKTNYAVTLKSHNATFNMSGLDKNDIRTVVRKLKTDANPAAIVVHVARQ